MNAILALIVITCVKFSMLGRGDLTSCIIQPPFPIIMKVESQLWLQLHTHLFNLNPPSLYIQQVLACDVSPVVMFSFLPPPFLSYCFVYLANIFPLESSPYILSIRNPTLSGFSIIPFLPKYLPTICHEFFRARSYSQNLGMQFSTPIPVPKVWE